MNDDPPSPSDAKPTEAPPGFGEATADSVIRRAATVVVLRPGAAGREVYMVRRSAKSPFMPSTLVFPGGRLDPEDGAPDEDATWERAARRECEEETRLNLDGRPLRWFDTWLTPSAESRRRYLTRFYAVELQADEGGHAKADGVETHEGRWATASAHLTAWEKQEVDLPPPTVTVLQRLRDAETGGLDPMLAEDPRDVILPKVQPQDGQFFILLPHDPGYASAPGDAAPAPDRALHLPRRFVRDGKRWRPC